MVKNELLSYLEVKIKLMLDFVGKYFSVCWEEKCKLFY